MHVPDASHHFFMVSSWDFQPLLYDFFDKKPNIKTLVLWIALKSKENKNTSWGMTYFISERSNFSLTAAMRKGWRFLAALTVFVNSALETPGQHLRERILPSGHPHRNPRALHVVQFSHVRECDRHAGSAEFTNAFIVFVGDATVRPVRVRSIISYGYAFTRALVQWRDGLFYSL